MTRLHVATNGTNFVAFVDEQNKAYIMDESTFGYQLTVEAAKAEDYSGIENCETAEDIVYAIGTPNAESNVIDWNEDDYIDCVITEF